MAANQRTDVVGASGSGKALTAAAVLGQLPVGARATGSIRVAGHEVLGRPGPQRPPAARPSMVFQDSSAALNPLVRVGVQVAEPLRRRHGHRARARQEARGLLGAVGLVDPARALDAYAAELSGGQRQQVCLALALACPAPLLVADEPTTALDVVTQAGITDLLAERTGVDGGPALLFITHDIAVAAALCSDVVVLDEGTVVQSGTMAGLLSAPVHPRAARLVEAARASRLIPVPARRALA